MPWSEFGVIAGRRVDLFHLIGIDEFGQNVSLLYLGQSITCRKSVLLELICFTSVALVLLICVLNVSDILKSLGMGVEAVNLVQDRPASGICATKWKKLCRRGHADQ